MLKRCAALLFIFVLAGQVWANACACFDDKENSHAKMSCCKSKKLVKTSISAKTCCDAPCGGSTNDRLPRSHAESAVKIPVPILAAVERLIISLDPRPKRGSLSSILKRRAGESPPRLLAHPPNLYLQNHAFLI